MSTVTQNIAGELIVGSSNQLRPKHIGNGEGHPLSRMPLHEYIERIFARDRNLVATSITRYFYHARKLSQTIGYEARVCDLTIENLNAMVARMVNAGYSLGTIEDVRCNMRTVWRHAAMAGILDNLPPVFRPDASGRFDPDEESDDGQMTLAQFFTDHYEKKRLLGASVSCAQKYRRHIQWLSYLLGRPAKLVDLNDDSITKVMQWVAAKGRSPATVNIAREQLMALANFANRRGMIRVVPDVAPMKEFKPSPTTWSPAELEKLLAAIRADYVYDGKRRFYKKPIAGVDARLWWEALIRTMLDCATRIGALLQVRWDDINLERGIIHIRAETQKNKEAQQHPLKPETVALLRAIKSPEREVVFYWPRDIMLVWRDLKRLLRSAGLPHGRRDMFHKLRRTTATVYEKAGYNATSLLGHSSRKVTECYLDPTVLTVKPASEVMFDLPAAKPEESQEKFRPTPEILALLNANPFGKAEFVAITDWLKQEHGILFADLARRLGVCKEHITHLRTGKRKPGQFRHTLRSLFAFEGIDAGKAVEV